MKGEQSENPGIKNSAPIWDDGVSARVSFC